ncbi:hypothetical protein [Leifsonia sp. Leaf264]|uniref:hypothetical protein n=1 Tax=Leifsonia sp. Leaf264 TaxID=1736314 RepID=UPI0006F9117A|nr:hypothetical protein [Leifsonia sp. Leaf264]KQO97742.1 hypothetical protein ASF30_15230 [Leifsonia sp. Leaf264]
MDWTGWAALAVIGAGIAVYALVARAPRRRTEADELRDDDIVRRGVASESAGGDRTPDAT